MSDTESAESLTDAGEILFGAAQNGGELPKSQEAETLPPKTDESPAAVKTDESPGEPNTLKTDESPESAKLSVSSIAEKLGLDAKQLYENLEIKLSDGSTVSIGQLKDASGKLAGADAELLEIETKRQEVDSHITQQRREIEQLMNYLPADALTPQALEAVRNDMQRQIDHNRELVLEAIPEWSDPDTADAEQSLMIDHVKPYGFTEGDFKRLYDSRLIRYIRDNQKRDALAKTLLAGRKITDGLKPSALSSKPTRVRNDGLTQAGRLVLEGSSNGSGTS